MTNRMPDPFSRKDNMLSSSQGGRKKGRIGHLLARRASSEEKPKPSRNSRSPTREEPHFASANQLSSKAPVTELHFGCSSSRQEPMASPSKLSVIEISQFLAGHTSSQQVSMTSLNSLSSACTNNHSSQSMSTHVSPIPTISDRSPWMGLTSASSVQPSFAIDDSSDPIFLKDDAMPQYATVTEATLVTSNLSLGNSYNRNRQVVAAASKALIGRMQKSLAPADHVSQEEEDEDDDSVLVDAAHPIRKRMAVDELGTPYRTNSKRAKFARESDNAISSTQFSSLVNSPLTRLTYQQSFSAGASVHTSVEKENVQQKQPKRVYDWEDSMLGDGNVDICSDVASAVLLDGSKSSPTFPPRGEVVAAIVRTRVPHANRCVPRKCRTFTYQREHTEGVTIPDLHRLVNFPEHLLKEGARAQCTLDGKRHCTMCGQLRFYSDKIAKGDTILTKHKALCTACVATGWEVAIMGRKVEIKWCVGHAEFVPWSAFGYKPMVAKCLCCREHQSIVSRKSTLARQKPPAAEGADEHERGQAPSRDFAISVSDSVDSKHGEKDGKVSPGEPASLLPPREDIGLAIVPTAAPNANRCVPRKYRTLSYNSPLEDTESICVPTLRELANFPDHIGVAATGKWTKDCARQCAMCGELRLYSERRVGGAHTFTPKNTFVCTSCTATGWVVTKSKLEIKWCSVHKNFLPWVAFGDRPMVTTCSHCRHKASVRQVLLRKENRKEHATAK